MKNLFIVGSTSEIAKILCVRSSKDSQIKIFLIGRSNPDWAKENKNIIFVPYDFKNTSNLDALFFQANNNAESAALIYLPSAQFGRVNLVNLDCDKIAEIIQVTLLNAILLVQSFAKSRPRSGSIVLFSSQAATFGGHQISSYAAAKAGLEAFVKGMARELGPLNVRINAISPGVINTSTFRKHAGDVDIASFAANIPLGRLGTAEDVANLVDWLISNKSEYVNGATIALTGGR